MGSPPQPPTPSPFSSLRRRLVAQVAAAPPGLDGSTADSFPFDDNRPDMKNTHTVMFIPGPQKRYVEFERVIDAFDAFDNRKLIPKHIKQNLAAAFPKERVEFRLATFGSSSTNPGAVAESEVNRVFKLDSGASHHAVCDVRLLTDFVPFSIDMWAVCADGTPLRIVGTGTLQMVGFRVPKVYAVERLTMNLISVGQLDMDHGLCCCFHSKQCEVQAHGGTVVGGAILQDDGMYELRFLEVPAEPEE